MERAHATMKSGLKAMLVEMTEKHKNEWYLHLPWVLLSRQVALLPDVGTSWAKLCTGCDPVFPGRLVGDTPIVTSSDLKGLVKHLEMEDDKTHPTTSNHNKSSKTYMPESTETCTHVYQVKKDNPTGLNPTFKAPIP